MKIIPAIDIIDGKCVRLSKGDYDTKKIYNENPVEVAKEFEDFGIQYLHLVDLDGAKAKKIINQKVIENIAKKTNLIIDFGGGIRSEEDLQKAFDSGAKKVTLGSVAVVNPELCLAWLEKFGAEKLILGADCLDRKIKTSGWLENSETDVVDFIKEYQKKGFKEVVCTDISKDGMLQGPSTALYQEIIENSTIELIASGGISNIEDVQKMKEIGCAGTIIGKAIYEGRISLEDLRLTISDF
ncbi:1-(5-phosphoribosyl)-5-[(5-phosphoribosylamino)methylideneamino]imidazole-4-carboxamide isomerase [Cloacibacterium normanense]|uniref:1-(5-phosphoribosyl)-5-[(5-phosphoribosylamino)methylideneamino] imidazole-4-carboxamide isomerase n=1 Tax=Cloacibacterium normanense TaxID=237258 RepID=A0A1E5UDG4_9FLAO|nr:1-(5-phosphoribosyl)-5-[(5-phosphoribosylamino)methylideneamino]imidazole-4-carboxamide isomerase [Cloacibacterium normanense]AZI69419.1 1-(5-phosphoribosyl)-5-[(5-phosphoribosylamino)methylideneamino]imidazole-4-carboxamide isomerase [Cloacibacterium normanense]OEL10827.1 1-(5-phosphoribosyl)-5-[(5-phosphoribosylamino)methylideneamino]imidazole-4-carboxamide isomerase [Cloacibacterium normanense]SDO45259.1 1-(5-phosphoribosyl)-5-[(5-phosphoribosylamino)methylideneamino] imidazole-4-carboxami